MKKCKAERGRCCGCSLLVPLVVFESEGGYCLKCSALLVAFVRAA